MGVGVEMEVGLEHYRGEQRRPSAWYDDLFYLVICHVFSLSLSFSSLSLSLSLSLSIYLYLYLYLSLSL